MNINVVININKDYLGYAMVMLKSLFDNNREHTVAVHWLNASVQQEDIILFEEFIRVHRGCLYVYKVNANLFDGFFLDNRWSVETYFRLLIPEILPSEIERALYLDADVIVKKDIHDLYTIDFEDHCMAVCENLDHTLDIKAKNKSWDRDENQKYFNAGVMLLNLKKMRKKCSMHQYEMLMKHSPKLFPMLDQDLLNYCVGADVLYVNEYKYNYIISPNMKIDRDAVIYHFATKEKPWKYRGDTDYFNLWWEYADKAEEERRLLCANV